MTAIKFVGQENRSMLQLLREHQVAPAFREAKNRAHNIVIGVPFWGRGAVATLDLSKSNSVRILCNLDQPGCNPDVIAEIRSLGISVRTNPRLHAKIYATEAMAIVGSSNVSTNGLSEEGSASKSWIEANIISDDPLIIEQVFAFFDGIWEHPDTRTISTLDIKAAQKKRNARPPSGFVAPKSKTLLAACRERPDEFDSVYVAAYSQGLGTNGSMLFSRLKKDVNPPQPGVSITDFRKAWGYQFNNIPEGAWLLDLDCRKSEKPRFQGSAQASGPRLAPKGEVELTIAHPGSVKHHGVKLPISAAEKTSLVLNAKRILDRSGGELISLAKVVKIIDHAR